MLKLNVFIVFALCSCTLLGQNLVSTAGETSTSGEFELDWSIGEIAIQTASVDHAVFTEGYHQPVLLVREIKTRSEKRPDFTENDLRLETYPNPSNDRVYLSRHISDAVFLTCMVTDRNGKFVTTFDFPEGEILHAFIVSGLPGGTYNLTCTSEKLNLQKTFLITVIH